jgi:hypothetical protein
MGFSQKSLKRIKKNNAFYIFFYLYRYYYIGPLHTFQCPCSFCAAMGYARNHVQGLPFSTEHLLERPNHESGFNRQGQVSLE